MLTIFDPYIDFVKIKSKIEICRDSKDDFLLALAKDGKVSFLITGDNDLLEIGQFGETSIIKITDFIKKSKR